MKIVGWCVGTWNFIGRGVVGGWGKGGTSKVSALINVVVCWIF